MIFTPAYAQAAGAAPGGATAFLLQAAPLLFIFAIFYVLMIRPQQKRAAEHRAMIDAVKKGDAVVTGGGLIGKVTRVDGEQVEVEIATGVKVKALRSTLTEVTPPGGAKPAND